ncbi:chaperonin 10-like protein [Penicillium atrosanguineum]|uniref:D-xylulose reductase n=1 Tax=Penicillium atrosanguineum TaxID=1132637 RepID=A0A9W9QB54_9EURO|nr:chaperonin 10-like protein [Penicillium atrosanguineum]
MSQNTNLSCVLFGAGKVRFENLPIPPLDDPHDILVRVAYVGVCGSDVHFWHHGGISRKVSEKMPLVMGHEASGIVDSIGVAVSSVKPGDRVAIEPGFPCRRCNQCKQGRYNICPDLKFAADPPLTNGTLCRLFRIPEDYVYKIPDSMSLQEAVLIEPLSVAVHGVRLAELRPGQSVLVQGSGTIGLMAAAAAKAFGARVIFISDINQNKLDFAKSFVDCTTFVPDVHSTPDIAAIKFQEEMGIPGGVDVVLECTGVGSSVATGLYACGPGAIFVQIGMDQPMQSIPLLAMSEKEVVLKTCFRYAPGDYEIALELVGSGKIPVKELISSTVPFEDATVAWAKTARGEGIKNLIQGVQD